MCQDVGRISDASYRRGMMDMTKFQWRRNEPVALGEPEQPELLSKALRLLETERNYGLPAIASDLALRPETLQSFVVALSEPARTDVLI